MQIEVNATKRDAQGTGASRRLRRAGRVPGIIYGGAAPPQPIEIDHNDLWQHLRKEAFHSSVLHLNLDGASKQVLLRDVQRHPFRQLILHVDFQRVDATHAIHQKVPLHFVNADIAPGVKLARRHGPARHDRTRRRVPAEGSAGVHRGRSEGPGQSATRMHVTQLKLPKGVEAVLHKGEDPVVATIVCSAAPR